ncbi:MAG: beta/gamma crystallin family protein [Methanotrichaceae archaeon]|nr:beta/gamma crystallin family protein [Methanotrichaceae archaeon]
MKTIAVILALLLAGIGIAAANGDPQGNATTLQEVIVFENLNMDGAHKHYFASDLDLTDNQEGKFWNDQISSIVVISGNWAFMGDPVGAVQVPNLPVVLGPGVYPDVKLKLIEDNTISQIRLES